MKKSTRTRKWFLTINQEAEVFPVVKDVLNELSTKTKYSLMLHDKDNEEQPHYHLVIDYKDAKTFQQVQKHFNGAHIEQVEFMYKVCRYLLHLDDENKYQYTLEELYTNCDQVEYYMNNDEFQKLEQESLLEYIREGTIYNITTAVQIYGIKQVNFYKNLIKELLEEMKATHPTQTQFNNGYNHGYGECEELMNKRLNEAYDVIDMHESRIDLLKRQIEMYKNKIAELEELTK